MSTIKVLTPGSGAASVRLKDPWFESNTTLNGGEDEVLMVDSYLKEGISTSQLDRSFSRGKATAVDFYLCSNCVPYQPLSRHVHVVNPAKHFQPSEK